MRVLITGFEPNDGGLNASQRLVESLRDDPPHVLRSHMDSIHFRIMPGNTNELGRVVDATLRDISPHICIGIGQARGYNKIALEKMAKNMRHFVTPDRAGNTPKGDEIVPDGPAAYWNTLPDMEGSVSLLENHDIPARIAADCGTHLCNQIYYHFLHWRETHDQDIQIGFVHIPVLPEQVIKHWPESPFMPLDMTRKALALLIKKQIEAGRP